jgi:hypothetical protein
MFRDEIPEMDPSENNLYVDFPESLPMDASQTISIEYAAKKTVMGGRIRRRDDIYHSRCGGQTADQMFHLASAWRIGVFNSAIIPTTA